MPVRLLTCFSLPLSLSASCVYFCPCFLTFFQFLVLTLIAFWCPLSRSYLPDSILAPSHKKTFFFFHLFYFFVFLLLCFFPLLPKVLPCHSACCSPQQPNARARFLLFMLSTVKTSPPHAGKGQECRLTPLVFHPFVIFLPFSLFSIFFRTDFLFVDPPTTSLLSWKAWSQIPVSRAQ